MSFITVMCLLILFITVNKMCGANEIKNVLRFYAIYAFWKSVNGLPFKSEVCCLRLNIKISKFRCAEVGIYLNELPLIFELPEKVQL